MNSESSPDSYRDARDGILWTRQGHIFNDLRYLLNGRCPIFNDLRYLFSGLFELRIDLGLSSAILIQPNPRPRHKRPHLVIVRVKAV